MFDVEFLQQPKIRSALVHLYDTGRFRAEVAAAVRRISDENEWIWCAADLDALGAAPNLLYGDVLLAVDLDAILARPAPARAIGHLARQAKDLPGVHLFVQGCGGLGLADMPEWDNLLSSAAVLHEPRVSAGTVSKLLPYVKSRSIVDLTELRNEADLDAAIREWVARTELTLPEFLSQLDVMFSSSIEGDHFDRKSFETSGGAADTSPIRWTLPLARFLREWGARERGQLLAEVSQALGAQHMSAHQVMSGIWRATFDLVKCTEALNPGGGVTPAGWTSTRWEQNRAHRAIRLPILVRWQMLLAHHEPRLLQNGLPAWDQLLRQVQQT